VFLKRKVVLLKKKIIIGINSGLKMLQKLDQMASNRKLLFIR